MDVRNGTRPSGTALSWGARWAGLSRFTFVALRSLETERKRIECHFAGLARFANLHRRIEGSVALLVRAEHHRIIALDDLRRAAERGSSYTDTDTRGRFVTLPTRTRRVGRFGRAWLS